MPFKGKSRDELEKLHKEGEVPKLAKELPREFTEIIKGLMAKES